MSDYLLPCASCGRSHRVSAGQAGGTLACPCGAKLEVPTMRELKKLEPAAVVAAPRQRVWGLPQGLMFVGVAVVGFGVAASCFFGLVKMPAPSEFKVPTESTANLTPAAALEFWRLFQKGITAQIPMDVARFRYLAHQREVAEMGLHIGWLVMALGGAMSATGIMISRMRARRG